MSRKHEFERLNSHISREYGRITAEDYDYQTEGTLYGDNDNAPPSYHRGISHDAAESRSSLSKIWLQKILSICAVGSSMLFRLLCIAFTVSLIVLGSYYVYDCPCEPFIPIYMIITGCLLCLLILYAVYRSCTITDVDNYEDYSETSRNIYRYITDFLYLFVFAWFITGSVKVYTIHDKVNFSDATSDFYCHPHVYQFTFWSITSFYILLASFFVMGMLSMIVKYIYSIFQK